MGRLTRTLSGLVRRTVQDAVRINGAKLAGSRARSTREDNPRTRPANGPGRPVVEYRVEIDGEPDPGEVVWGWVPYEDDPSQGKDRPVLLLSHQARHDAGEWVGLMLSSRDHTRDPGREARYGRIWMDVGTGAWDREHRPSEVRLDRLVRLPDSAIRREGAALPKVVFDAVVARARELHDLG
ncbi:type II toxin-antitoxin system PemK/MazF family toxin [Nocardioides gilvus]|uniref:type II toxin-antitoxin system PemK/MazF family toxin n=1 Tax=Nocardioides gilvus TaxID=1735589 RepID=UPI000D74B0A2|nr:type II toxin-antitoxin system PemK/MazF family toxin [Nocardioides gilvus]